MERKPLQPVRPFGQPASTKEFEAWLATKFNPPKIQKTQQKNERAKTYGWISLGSIICLAFFFVIGIILTAIHERLVYYYRALIAMALLCFIAFVLALVFGILWISNQNWKIAPKKVRQEIPRNIYSQYYKMVYPNSPLKFNDIQPSTNFPGGKMFSFNVNGEFIEWDISEHTVERNRYTQNGAGIYNAWMLEYKLTATSKKLDEFDNVVIRPRLDPKSVEHPEINEFVSASMSFNQKYIVTSNNPDRIPVTRIFDPSVINYFDHMNAFPSEANHITLGNGKAVISWQSMDHASSWNAGIDNFVYLSGNQRNNVELITRKITSDFNRFFINFNSLRPFDFYHLYPQEKSN